MEEQLNTAANFPQGIGQLPKRKPTVITITKIANGYLVGPNGLYFGGEILATYIASLENLPEAVKNILDTEV